MEHLLSLETRSPGSVSKSSSVAATSVRPVLGFDEDLVLVNRQIERYSRALWKLRLFDPIAWKSHNAEELIVTKDTGSDPIRVKTSSHVQAYYCTKARLFFLRQPFAGYGGTGRGMARIPRVWKPDFSSPTLPRRGNFWLFSRHGRELAHLCILVRNLYFWRGETGPGEENFDFFSPALPWEG